MSWFKRQAKGIKTALNDQINVPEGQWVKCPGCSQPLNARELGNNLLVCPKCTYHFKMTSQDYFELLFDDRKFRIFDDNLISVDPLDFTDKKAYTTRLKNTRKKTGLSDSARAATGKVGGHSVSMASMDFSFIGGSMGSVVGEVITRAIKRACRKKTPLILITQSGGARMMEGALSLMQMAKTAANLTKLSDKGLPFIVILTNPTTGGVTASFAMLGDVHIAEPGALIGFAGPRIIRETMGQDLPDGFQKSEFVQEHGFIDMIVERKDLRGRLIHLLHLFMEAVPLAD